MQARRKQDCEHICSQMGFILSILIFIWKHINSWQQKTFDIKQIEFNSQNE